MIDPKYFELIKDKYTWNEWYQENLENHPNLSGINLSGRNLSGYNFSGINLSNAKFCNSKLIDTDFCSAFLENTNYIKSDLHYAHFTGADLTNADFSDAILYNADLSYCTLKKTKFISTILDKTDFLDALFNQTTFNNLCLDVAKNLDKCNYENKSYIDTSTISKSPLLPSAFYKGFNLYNSDIEISKLVNLIPHYNKKYFLLESAREFRAKKKKYNSCFISHSSKDIRFVTKLFLDLRLFNVNCFVDYEDMKGGDKIPTIIEKGIKQQDKLLLVFSESSIKSDWVEKEVEIALIKEKNQKVQTLLPIKIDNSIDHTKSIWASDIKNGRHIIDFCNWHNNTSYESSFLKLIKSLESSSL